MNFHNQLTGATYSTHPINTGQNNDLPCSRQILEKIQSIFNYMTQKYRRVLFVRFDLRFPMTLQVANGNEYVSHFFKMLKENAQKRQIEFHFVWVREQKHSENPHYHCIVLLNGDKVQKYKLFLMKVNEAWGHVTGTSGAGYVEHCDSDKSGNKTENGIMIHRPPASATGKVLADRQQAFDQQFARCFHWASYLAKMSQKELTPPGVRCYGSSQIKAI